jgi:hypothetical protein
MSYLYKVLESFPLVFYPMSSVSLIQDYSGNNNNATVFGTPVSASPLVSGGGDSFAFDDTDGISFTTGIFVGTNATRAFTLEAWFKNKNSTGVIQILGHNHAGDGITWNGDAVTFTTMHGAAGNCTVSYYPPDIAGGMMVTAIHTESKNQLYVNAVLVAESDMTDAQKVAGYTTTANPGVLYSGHVISGTGSVIVDAIAVYDRPLPETEISDHYNWGIRVVDTITAVAINNGIFWPLTDDYSKIVYELNFNDQLSWQDGIPNQVYITDYLYPSFNNSTTSVAGSWSYGLLLESISSILDGSKIEWDGDGSFTIDVSLDNGTTWTTCTNELEIPGISKGYSTAAKTLIIRVSFAAGLSQTTNTVVRNVTLKFYSSRDTIANNNQRKINLVGNVALSSRIHQPIEAHDGMGLNEYNGYAVLPKDTDAVPAVARSLEFWFKFNNTPVAGSYLIDARDSSGDANVTLTSAGVATGATFYVNGKTPPGAYVLNKWYHGLLVLNADNLKNITIGAMYDGTNQTKNISFGTFAVYPTALTATQASQLYNAYMGIPVLAVDDTSIIGLVEDSVTLYDSTWT